LDLFCTGFRLGTITPKDTRGGPSCAYNVVINEEPVEVGGAQIAGEPSFRSALSAGDRSALALAFFFASLDQDQALSAKAVVIDDPISSLDDHRALTTVQEIRNLTRRTAQVILLSHNKRFLCQLWDSKNGSQSAAFEVAVGDSGSTLRKWNVSEDCVTEHDKRHERMRKYLEQGVGDPRQIAADIRHLLEISLRVSYPKLFPAGKMIRSFINECNRASAGSQETFSRRMLDELSRLNEYTSRYHHDTNPAWLAEQINDTELRSHVNRTFKFIQLDKSGR
jgi:wobble nucleotide-excising tRNase